MPCPHPSPQPQSHPVPQRSLPAAGRSPHRRCVCSDWGKCCSHFCFNSVWSTIRLNFTSSFHSVSVSTIRSMPSCGIKFLGSPFSKTLIGIDKQYLALPGGRLVLVEENYDPWGRGVIKEVLWQVEDVFDKVLVNKPLAGRLSPYLCRHCLSRGKRRRYRGPRLHDPLIGFRIWI